MSETPDCGGDAAAYALGALDDHELDAFRRHLQTCSVCQADVESLQQLAGTLALSAPQYPMRRQLRRRVMAEVRADARAQRQLARAPSGVPGVPRGFVPRYRAGVVGGVAALVLVLAVVLVGLTASGPRHATGTPGVYSASVGSAQLIVRGDRAELIVHHLTHLSPSRTYEVWLQHAGGPPQPTSALFNVSSNGDASVSVPQIRGAKVLMVTREPAGGRAKPTLPALVVTHIG